MNPEEDQPVAGPSHRNDNQDSDDELMSLEFQPPRILISPMKLFNSAIPRRRSSEPTHQKSPEHGHCEPLEEEMRHMQELHLEEPQHHLQQLNQNLSPDYDLPEIPPSQANLDLVQQQQMHQLDQQQEQQQEQRHQHQQHQQLQQQIQPQQQLEQLQEQQQQQQPKTHQDRDAELMPPPPNPPPKQQQQEPQEQPQQQQQAEDQQAEDQQADAEASTSGAGDRTPTTPSELKVDLVALCKMGQNVVHEIFGRFKEITRIMGRIAPPNDSRSTEKYAAERKNKLIENVERITWLFKRLRFIHDCYNENSHHVQGLECIDVGSLVPMKEDPEDGKFEDRKDTETYRAAEKLREKMLRNVIIRNRMLKSIMSLERRITCSINTMMGSRRNETSDDKYT